MIIDFHQSIIPHVGDSIYASLEPGISMLIQSEYADNNYDPYLFSISRLGTFSVAVDHYPNSYTFEGTPIDLQTNRENKVRLLTEIV